MPGSQAKRWEVARGVFVVAVVVVAGAVVVVVAVVVVAVFVATEVEVVVVSVVVAVEVETDLPQRDLLETQETVPRQVPKLGRGLVGQVVVEGHLQS